MSFGLNKKNNTLRTFNPGNKKVFSESSDLWAVSRNKKKKKKLVKCYTNSVKNNPRKPLSPLLKGIRFTHFFKRKKIPKYFVRKTVGFQPTAQFHIATWMQRLRGCILHFGVHRTCHYVWSTSEDPETFHGWALGLILHMHCVCRCIHNTYDYRNYTLPSG